MKLATVSNDLVVTTGNSIPLNAWSRTTEATSVSMTSAQALLIISIYNDSFWGFFYTPTADSALAVFVPSNTAYCLFTKPSSFTSSNLAIALESSEFPDPVLIINGAEEIIYNNARSYMNFYKFDITPYFSQ